MRAASKRPSMDLKKNDSNASSSCQEDGAVCMKVTMSLLGIGSSRMQRATRLHSRIGLKEKHHSVTVKFSKLLDYFTWEKCSSIICFGPERCPGWQASSI